MADIIKKIMVSDLFKNIDINNITSLLNEINYKVINSEKNEYIFDNFLDSNYIGLILSGTVNIEKVLPSGKSVFMYSKKKGDIFGEVAAFSKSKQYPCNVISYTKSLLVIFHKSDFFKLLALNSDILDNILELVCNKTFFLNKRISTLSFTSAREKIVHSILNDFFISEDFLIKIPFTKQCWANILNISRASLYRELNILCDEGLISFCKTNIIKIINIHKLEKIILD